MKYCIIFSLLVSSTAWAIVPMHPYIPQTAATLHGDKKTHDAMIKHQQKRVKEYQKHLRENMQRLVEAKAKLWQLEHEALPLEPGPAIPQNTSGKPATK